MSQAAASVTPPRRMALHTRILIGFLVGTFAGVLCYWLGRDAQWLSLIVTYVSQPVGQIFLRLLLMLVIPLLFSALVLGVSEMGDLRSLGRVGWKTLVYTVAVSAIAVLIGLVLVNVLQPGAGMPDETRSALLEGSAERAKSVTAQSAPPSGMEMLVQIVPDNVVRAAANGDMLGIMFFALMFGIALVLTRTPSTDRVKEFVQGVYDIAMTLIDKVIQLAPYAVACLLFTLVAKLGWSILWQLGKYVGVVLLALAIHQFVVYSLVVKVFGGMSPRVFFKGVEEAMLTAFSTASSSATLPTSLKVAEEKLKLPPRIARFVLTVGATANQNGTALFEGVTVLFLAQFYGIELSMVQQVTVLGVCILGGIGTAGVPSGSIPVVMMILAMVKVPVEGIGLILGVNHLLDMSRTTLNVTGDLAAAVVVSRGEPDEASSRSG
ncbi:dicarboxylate/amino acid:cation symporter [Tahibacter amnicola]|uniref:Dicarboxylate/amino acid:cation symporter n=1 Tax=Tahibacter amnicola TaxID=2976241 RepID=A0ABY6BGU7_9GAMM|nr:dicarboxylate/amino acid:cation symporter [Tahibacter amnicola]UXI69002.1 dicarboxylate/amino acid:cation symporter [Tahibacter amnicola]